MIIDTNILILLVMDSDQKHNSFCLNHSFIAPSIIELELINVLRKYHYFNGISIDIIEQYYQIATNLIYKFYNIESLIKLSKQLSFELNHPIYDCVYLALAMELDMSFCSLDSKLIKKASDIGIPTYKFIME